MTDELRSDEIMKSNDLDPYLYVQRVHAAAVAGARGPGGAPPDRLTNDDTLMTNTYSYSYMMPSHTQPPSQGHAGERRPTDR